MLQMQAKSATLWLVLGKTARAMTDASNALPNEIDALRALILAERAAHALIIAERDKLAIRNERLEAIIAEIRRAHFGRKSERITDDQLALALDELETSLAKMQAEEEKADPALKAAATRRRRASRNENLDHLPHEEVVIEPESKVCPCCGGELHVIGEDASKRLDKIPAKVRVIVTRRPKYACRTCEKVGADNVAGIIQASAPPRLIEGGLPTEALVADVVVSKHADHLPLYRQSQILARYGVRIERTTLAQWVGAAAAEFQPLHDHLIDGLKASARLFCDETRCPVLDPGAGKTKTGFMWAIARDDRPWGGADPPAVAYSYAPGRGGEHALRLLAGFSGILQVDGYAGYNKLAAPTRPGGPVTLAYCWSHLRRQFYEVYVGGNAPIATETLARIKLLYDIEADIRGMPPDVRRAIRQQRSKPVIEALKPWFEASLAKVPKGAKLAEALGYGLNHWRGLCRYLDDGRIEIGRVEMWRGCGRPSISVSAPFVWRCLTNSTLAPSPHPARQTGRADFPHPAFSRPVKPSLSAGRHVAPERYRGRVSRRDTRLGSGETRRLVVSSGASTIGGPVVQCMLE
jgi:transposase